MRKGKTAVIKTSTRQTVFLPLIGLVPPERLEPQDLIGVNKDSYLVLDTLPAEYDSRVRAMEVDERPTETYTDIGGLEKQIEELVEAIVLPMEQADKFKTLGIKPPKGCLMYGPPGEWYLHYAASSPGVHPTKELERLSLPEHVLHRQMLATSNWLVPRWYKCSLVMAPSLSATPSSLQKRKHQPSSLLTSWMQ
jgi:Proteasomal ATPase OB C-terminal domain